MANVWGASSLVRLAIPTGIDSTEILKRELRSGRTGEDAVRLAAQVIGAMNATLLAGYEGMLTVTDMFYAYDTQGNSSKRKTPRKVEGSRPDPIRTENIGHMLPYHEYDDVLAWTREYLIRSPERQLEGDLAEIARSYRNRFKYEIWKRALTDDENAIGSTGYDVGWANGTAGSVDYVPPQTDGYDAHATSHSHYLYKDDDSNDWADLFESMMLELRHHGHTGMLSIWVSLDDIGEVELVDGFVELKPENMLVISSGADNPRNPQLYMNGMVQGVPGELFGYFKCKYGMAELRWEASIPTNYAFGTKSYGANNQMNGLALRVDPVIDGGNFGLQVEPILSRHIEPRLESVEFEGGYGVGVNDRTNGVAGLLLSGAAAWADPTDSDIG